MREKKADSENALVIMRDYEGGELGIWVERSGRKAFITDGVLSALAFVNGGLASNLSFRTLIESFTRQLNALADTPDWDRDKKRRLKEELGNLFARGCASWYDVGRSSVKQGGES